LVCSHAIDDRERGMYGAHRVVFMRLRITEIGEHTVTEVLGDVSPVVLDRFWIDLIP
jgi:hypothetical protein